MKRSLLLLMLSCSAFYLNACAGGGGSTTPPPGGGGNPPPAAATHLSVTTSATPLAGTPFNVTVTALDASGSVVSTYSGTVHFTSTDKQAALPADSKLTNGTGTFSVTFKTSGSQTITATDSTKALTAGTSSSISISPAAATHFTVTTPPSATTGAAFNVTVTAFDAFSNVATSYAGSVHLTSSDGQCVLPAPSGLTNGVETFPVTLNTAGSQTITATDSAVASITGISNSINVPAITISLAPTTVTVQEGTSAPFKATVTNDGANKGVNWTVSCSTAPCGSVSPTTTASGAPTSYTAPGASTSDLTVTLTAASVSNPAVSASATITIPGITISIAPSSAVLHLGDTQQFTATVTNDPSKGGVTWSLGEDVITCTSLRFCHESFSFCSPACGTISPASSASGVPATYTAPAQFTPPFIPSCPLGPPCPAFLGVFLQATSVTDSSAFSRARITILPPSISVSPTSASVPSGGTQQFTATVTNDPSNGGVTWSLKLSYLIPGLGRHIVPCGSSCGTISPAGTASGTPTTYTAPATPPQFPPGACCGRSVLIVATSATSTNAFSQATITVRPISVSVSPNSASVAVSATQQFTATVTNDATSSGANWTLTQNGVTCSPGCGTISPTKTASATAATYNAPATVPPLNLVTVTATSVEDPTKSARATITVTTATGAPCSNTGSESLLKGQYAFLLHGFDSITHVAIVGSVTADGAGKITAGEEDILRAFGSETDVSINATGSSYAVGPDHRGCLILANANGETTHFWFALGSLNSSSIATSGHIIEIDDTTGTGTRAAGTIRLQDASSFMASQFNGNYTFGVAGGFGGRFAMAGTFTSDGVSAITSSNFDIDNVGALTSNVSSTPGGSYTCCTTNGRGTLQISSTGLTIDFWMYRINSGDAFLVSNDVSVASGEAIGIPSVATFTQASLNGASVIRKTAQSSSGPFVDIATASANGTGAMTVTDNVNDAGTFATTATALNYLVAANGRVTVAGGSTPPVLYLYGPNQGFLVGTDPNVEFGIIEPQAAGPFNDASLSGAYMFGTENPSANTVTLESGVVTPDKTGNAAGTSDQSSSAGLTQNQSISPSYSVSSSGTGTFGSGTTAILISGNKLVFINNTSATPTITVVEK